MDEGSCHLQEGNTANESNESAVVEASDTLPNDQPDQSGETRGPKSRKKRPAACDSMLMVSSEHPSHPFHHPRLHFHRPNSSPLI